MDMLQYLMCTKLYTDLEHHPWPWLTLASNSEGNFEPEAR